MTQLRKPRTNKDTGRIPTCTWCQIPMRLNKKKTEFECDECTHIIVRRMPLTIVQKQARNRRRNERQAHEKMLKRPLKLSRGNF